jgi:hypothetical protein
MRDILTVRAEAYHEFVYPRAEVEPPGPSSPFMRAARVYELEIEHLRRKLAEAEQAYERHLIDEGLA